jgi:putative restriction endonuclease
VIIYPGHGGQDPVTREQIADQELARQNLALAVSMQQGLPVRVVRGFTHRSQFSPDRGYRYDGLFAVESFWHERGASGFKVWRFRLVRRDEPPSTDELESDSTLSQGNALPGRTKTSVSRVIRDTELSTDLKRLYNFTCQVCGTRLEGPAGPYVEAAHVRPLGRPQRTGHIRQLDLSLPESPLPIRRRGIWDTHRPESYWHFRNANCPQETPTKPSAPAVSPPAFWAN